MKPEFTRIDPMLNTWAKKFGLHIYRMGRDEEVRAVSVVDDEGMIYSIWIEMDGSSFIVNCHWTLGRKVDGERVEKSWSASSPMTELPINLDNAYAAVEQWIKDNGHTRTLVK